MSFKRKITPSKSLTGLELDQALVSIGIRLATEPSKAIFNIEDVLLSASIEGICDEDYRVLGLLTDWIEVHGRLINLDRLAKLISLVDNGKVRRFWKAISQWQVRDSRFKKLGKLAKTKGRQPLIEVGGDFLIKKNGEDERFRGTALQVPNLTLRRRLGDIQPPQSLARMNPFYHFRLMIGPSYRADLWALLSRNRELTPTELARLAYASFATAWSVKRDFQIFEERKSGTALA